MQNINPVKSYGKTIMTVCVLSLWENYKWDVSSVCQFTYEPPHDKTSKVAVRPAKTQISLGIHPV